MVDIALAAFLLIGIPMLVVWRERSGIRRSRIARYRSAVLMISGCLSVLALQWAFANRNASALGLRLPPTKLGWICLLGAALLMATLAVAARRKEDVSAKDADDPFPQTTVERAGYILFAFAAGSGWEILYRGFLLWFLIPLVGIVAAIGLAVLAYGVAHGIKDRRMLMASIASALVFTTAYGVTHEILWLMLIHTGLPLIALMAPREQPS
ncbi:CPBP family intramembrane glutamic endopeptidase [Sphingomonas sp. CFBP 8760]|uniref:CPBP family intramembrane glutamic endopeptidase n=1 Tax=Sphingomonas sp. CFBP 8760 TaxID=2775282 RepID=UPI001785D441|nr:CPBP family intramembrane glutamic endopeptidase [Sphingomonas sp. CFBP 8760]MBD8545484.1 CPBP family intramembrane metalloprotease [Sphingomonas sp. CFBP 8760]